MSSSARAIAFYLPQFHPIPENDQWWGPGFSEWTNVARGRPLFRGHRQPRLPGELGFYDLRLAETRAAQAALALDHGVEGFMYWHYWFGGGHRILERPFQEVLDSGQPEFPFCLGWANQTWSGIWYDEADRVLVEQTYPGVEDEQAHFESILPALRDPRYITVDGRPLFIVHRPADLPDAAGFASRWRAWSAEHDLSGLHLVGIDHLDGWEPSPSGFDGVIRSRLGLMFGARRVGAVPNIERVLNRLPHGQRLSAHLRGARYVFSYRDVARRQVQAHHQTTEYPVVVPDWDNTPRSGDRGSVLVGSTPELWAEQVRAAATAVADHPPEHRLLFLKSWNEWAEGNYLEPDRDHGRAYLEALQAALP